MAGDVIDSLSIELNSDAKKANDAVGKLIEKLENLKTSISNIEGNNFSQLSTGVKSLADGMKQMQGVKKTDFNRLASGLEKISSVKLDGGIAEKIQPLATAIQSLNNIKFDTKNIQSFINSISRLGNANLGNLSNVDFSKIGNSIRTLASSLANAETVQQSTISMTNAVAKLANAGEKVGIVSSSLGQFGTSLSKFFTIMSRASAVSSETIQFTQAIASLANAGNKVSATSGHLGAFATELKKFMQVMASAPKVNSSIIQMTQATANLAAQGQKVGSATKGLAKGFSAYGNSTANATSKTKSLASMFGKLYANFFWVRRGISGIKDAVKSSMDYIETLNYFDAAFGQVADTAVKDWKDAGYKSAEQYYNSFSERAKKLTSQMSGYNISPTGSLEATGKASLGIDPNQLMNYQATFAQMSSSIGMTGEQSVKLSRVLTEIGADLASVKNMDFKKTWNDMASGLAGMSRTLDKYGVNIRNVNLQQKLSDIGIQANIQNLNQNEKALLRTIILLNSTKYAYGDLAETINQPANQVRLLQANFQNLSRTIGNLFLPVVAKILPYINGLAIALQRLFTYVGKKLGLDISGLTSSVGDSSFDMSELADNTDDVAGGLDDASKKAKKLKNNINTIGIDKLNIISKDKDKTDKDDNKGLNNSDLAKLNKAFEDAYEKYQKAWDKAFAGVDNKALQIADKITNAFKKGDYKGIGTYISDNLTKALKSINWNSIYEGAAKFGTGLAEFLNGLITPELFYEVGKTIAKLLGTKIQFALNFFQEFDWSNLGESLANGINGFFENYPFEDMANALNKFVDGLEKALFSFIKNVNWWHVFTGLWDFFTNLEIDTLLVIPMLRAFMKIRKNAGSTFKALQTIGSTSLKKLSKGFSFLSENIKVLGGKDGIAYTFMEARDSMSKTTKVMMGAGGILAAFAGVKNATKGMANGTKSVVAGLGQIALSAGVAGAALTMVFGFPAGIIVAGCAAAIGAIAGVIQASEEAYQEEIKAQWGLSEETKKTLNEIDKRVEKSADLRKKTDEQAKENTAEIDQTQKLWTELKKITDENGKIKKGYQGRAKFITKELSESLGIEIKMTDGVIQKYDELRKSVKQVIAEKKKNLILDAYSDKYTDALTNRSQEETDLETATRANNTTQYKLEQAQKEYEKAHKDFLKTRGIDAESNYEEYKNVEITAFENTKQGADAKDVLEEAEKAAEKTQKTFNEAKENLEKDVQLISNYEKLLSTTSEGGIKKLNKRTDNLINGAGEKGKSYVKEFVGGVTEQAGDEKEREEITTKFESFLDTSIANVDVSEAKRLLQEKLEKMFGSLGEMRFQLGMQVETTATKITGNWADVGLDKALKDNDVKIKTTMKRIPPFATGGFPEDGLFLANHSELVGKFSNGKTAVANNQQITDGIEEAAYRGYMRALATQGSNSTGGTQRIEIPVIIDGKEITRIVNKNNSRNGAKIMGNETRYVYG